MKDFPPRIKKRIREYSMQAHENELKVALAELALKFKAWEASEIGSGDMSNTAHRNLNSGWQTTTRVFLPPPPYSLKINLFNYSSAAPWPASQKQIVN